LTGTLFRCVVNLAIWMYSITSCCNGYQKKINVALTGVQRLMHKRAHTLSPLGLSLARHITDIFP